MARRRISITKENRIVDLYVRQGYPAEVVARICNCSIRSVHTAVKRVRRRVLHPGDPRLGRRRAWLDDDQVRDILYRRKRGETFWSISRDYHQGPNSIARICNNKSHTYLVPEF